MAAGKWLFTNEFITKLASGTFDFSGHTFKVALFASTTNLGAGSTTYSGVSNEVANGNGYTTGGVAVTIALSGTTTVTVDSNDPEWTGSGAGFSARRAALYDVTAGRIVCYSILDSADVTWAASETKAIQLHANGYFQMAQVP